MIATCLLWGLWSAGAFGQAADTVEDPAGPDDIELAAAEPVMESLPYPPLAYRGAEMLNMEPGFVAAIQEGLELVYLRRYDDALRHFRRVESNFDNTAIAPVAEALVWQARMLENFDYRYDKEYWAASKRARKALSSAMKAPGREAWEHLLMAGVVGVEAIHTMRQSQYLSALTLAFQAMDEIGKSREAAPAFIDLKLADGLYNYWRTVITMNSKMLPSFGDHREKGIAQMREVEADAVFMKPIATLSLAFAWMEEKDMRQAERACGRNRKLYPNNVVNNLVTAMVAVRRRQFDKALASLDQVHQVDPKNTYAYYWKGLALLRKGDLPKSERALLTYLQSEHLEKHQLAAANYRLGQLESRKEDYSTAVEYFAAAVRANRHKAAKRSMDRLKERKKEGQIDW